MTDPAEAVGGETFPVGDSGAEVTLNPVGGGEVELSVSYEGDVVERGKYPTPAVFEKPTPRGTFLNSVEESLADRDHVDEAVVRQELKEWLAEFADMSREEEAKHLLPAEIQAIINGTQYPVEIYDGEPTTWKVVLSYAGRTRELEFTAGEMVNGGGSALEEKLANQFFELVEIEKEDWEAIRDRWQDNARVVYVSEETTADAIADRVLERLRHSCIPVDEREKMGNDTAAVWYDSENEAAYENADPGEAIAWVQDSFLVDELENAGKSIEYKAQLVKNLIARGDLYGSRTRRRWFEDTQRRKFYPFDPDVLEIDDDDLHDPEPAHSEVDP